MSIRPFHITCDICKKVRSAEYESLYVCRECLRDVCSDCAVNPADDESGKVTCIECVTLTLT